MLLKTRKKAYTKWNGGKSSKTVVNLNCKYNEAAETSYNNEQN